MTFADYPRMLFHRNHDPVIVQSEEEEAALGAEWSRIILSPEEPAAVAIPSPAEPEPPQPEPPEPEPPRRGRKRA